MLSFRHVPAESLASVWPTVYDGLRQIMVKSKHRTDWVPEDIVHNLLERRAQLYFGYIDDEPRGFFILELILYPVRYLNIQALYAKGEDSNHAGVLGFRDEAIDCVDRIAQAVGVERIRIMGREGWERALKGKFSVKHVVYERTIERNVT